MRDNLEILTDADIEALETLMERPDPELADWLTGRRADRARGRDADAAAHPREPDAR